MARKQIARITLYGNTVSWMDPINCIYLTTHKAGKLEAIVYDDMDLNSIREGIAKCLIKIIEGKLPEISTGEDVPVDQEALENLINQKVKEAIADGIDLSGYATVEELQKAVTDLIGGADESSDTLKELADLLAKKADKDSVEAMEGATVEETVELYNKK